MGRELQVADPREGIGGSIAAARDHLLRHQREHGGWSGRNNSMLFCLPLYVGAAYASHTPIDSPTRQGMLRFLRAYQKPDGGFPLHLEGQQSLIKTTAMCYVAMRLLGVPPDDPMASRARTWLHEHGGPLGCATMGKAFLAVMGLFDYRAVDPVPPELWLLPARFHPKRLYGHMRANYIPLAILFGHRLALPPDEMLTAVREELYPIPYDEVDWDSARGRVAHSDSLVPRSRIVRALDAVLAFYDRHPIRSLREASLGRVLAVLEAEDRNTGYECFSLITKTLHTFVWSILEPDGEEARRHGERLSIYLEHDDPDGIDARTCSSSVQWDTSFAILALLESARSVGEGSSNQLPDEYCVEALDQAQAFLASRQILVEPESVYGYRSRALGGWSFSEYNPHWPVTDCTAEALRACLSLAPIVSKPLAADSLQKAVGYLLHHQNDDGGWPAYEKVRTPGWVERLNRTDVFGKVMRDYSHVECTGSCIQALVEYRERFPSDRPHQVERALARAEEYLRNVQRPDGSFVGYWGVCFTYAAWFAIAGLRVCGAAPDDPAVVRARQFLEGWQRDDGGWGESVEANRRLFYVPGNDGHPVMTAWAVLALISAGRRDSEAVRRGIRFVQETQRSDGGWDSPGISGAFMQMHAMAYGSHVRIFPLWALSSYAASADREDD